MLVSGQQGSGLLVLLVRQDSGHLYAGEVSQLWLMEAFPGSGIFVFLSRSDNESLDKHSLSVQRPDPRVFIVTAGNIKMTMQKVPPHFDPTCPNGKR